MSVWSEQNDEELQELRVTLQALKQRNAALEKQLQEALMKIQALNAKRDRGGISKEKAAELKRLPESAEELRWQLLTTLRLLRRSELANEEIEQRLRKITFLAGDAVKTAEKIDARKRASLEEEIRAIRKLLGPPDRTRQGDEGPQSLDTGALKDAKVVDIRKDLSLVVINIGKKHGVSLGMPFDIVRGGKLVATVVIVEVRDGLCGALIERMEESNPVRMDDSAILRRT